MKKKVKFEMNISITKTKEDGYNLQLSNFRLIYKQPKSSPLTALTAQDMVVICKCLDRRSAWPEDFFERILFQGGLKVKTGVQDAQSEKSNRDVAEEQIRRWP